MPLRPDRHQQPQSANVEVDLETHSAWQKDSRRMRKRSEAGSITATIWRVCDPPVTKHSSSAIADESRAPRRSAQELMEEANQRQ